MTPTISIGAFPIVQVKPSDMAEAKRLLDPNQYKVAMQAAISDTLTTIRKEVVNRVQKELVIKDRDAKKLFTVKKPSFNNLVGSVIIKREQLPLHYFAPRYRVSKKGVKPPGVSVLIRRSKGRQVLKSTFLLRGKVVERAFTAGVGSKRFGRKPLRFRQGPTLVGYLAGAPGVLAEETAKARDTLNKRVVQNVRWVLENGRGVQRLLAIAARSD